MTRLLATAASKRIKPARIVPDQLYEMSTRTDRSSSEHRISAKTTRRPFQCYTFGLLMIGANPLSLIWSAADAFIDEVIARTALLRHHFKSPSLNQPQVNLVGRSMGGLIIAGCCKRGGDARIGKIVSLAAPFRGSFESIIESFQRERHSVGLREPSSAPRGSPRHAALLPPCCPVSRRRYRRLRRIRRLAVRSERVGSAASSWRLRSTSTNTARTKPARRRRKRLCGHPARGARPPPASRDAGLGHAERSISDAELALRRRHRFESAVRTTRSPAVRPDQIPLRR